MSDSFQEQVAALNARMHGFSMRRQWGFAEAAELFRERTNDPGASTWKTMETYAGFLDRLAGDLAWAVEPFEPDCSVDESELEGLAELLGQSTDHVFLNLAWVADAVSRRANEIRSIMGRPSNDLHSSWELVTEIQNSIKQQTGQDREVC